MIELRWLEKMHVPEHEGATGYAYKVLQYRQRAYETLGPFSGYSNKWSDWQDVPTVPAVSESG